MNNQLKNFYQTATIIKVITETAKVKTFILDKKVVAKPGQYVMVWLPRINEKPFGIVSANPLTLSIAKVGPFTEKIHQLKKGDKITFRGPYGNTFKLKNGQLLLVAGGYGVVPLYFFAQSQSPSQRKKITVVIGAKTKNELTFVNKFKKLGCQVKVTTDDGSCGVAGFCTDLVKKLINQEKFSGVYTCGPEVMMKKVALLCKEKKLFCQVCLERFFKCGGMGLCGECSLKGHLVCKEGPVFNAKILL